MNIGKNIRNLRKANNLTLNELAKKINSSSGYLSDIENNKNLPSIPKLLEICTALNITLSDFFNEDNQNLSMELSELITLSKNLTPEQLHKLTEFIKSIK